MTRMYPAVLDPETRSPAERQLYRAFKRQLNNEWIVFHSVRWLDTQGGQPRDGETDFIVAHPRLGILVMEVKGGAISFDEATGCYVSTDSGRGEHPIGDPFQKATADKHLLIAKLRRTPHFPNRRIVFGHMVAFSDAVVEASWLRLNAPRDIIIDAQDLNSLEERLRSAMGFWRGENPTETSPGKEGINSLIRLLAQSRRIRHPLLAEKARADQEQLVKLTESQYRYLRFLGGQRRAAIAGCAGSGKTFLAVEKARSLSEDEGLDVLFTCYNRALADHVGDTLGYRQLFDVFSFHQLCFRIARRAGEPVSYRGYRSPEYYDVELPNALLEGIEKLGSQYDAIIVDEGQDFRAGWWEALPWLLHHPGSGILYAFYDSNQQVYPDRGQIPIETTPFLISENCRNTRRVFKVVEEFYAGTDQPTVLGPEGTPVKVIEYAGERGSRTQLRKLLHYLLTENRFEPREVAILTARGTNSSVILGRRFGNYQLTDQLPLKIGEVFATTIRRFKGLDRPAIVLCEVDGTLTQEETEALMYVGTSRAKAYLAILVAASAPVRVRESLL